MSIRGWKLGVRAEGSACLLATDIWRRELSLWVMTMWCKLIQCVCVCAPAHGCYFGSVIISRTGGVTSVLWLFDNTWVLSAHWRWICLRDILPCFCVSQSSLSNFTHWYKPKDDWSCQPKNSTGLHFTTSTHVDICNHLCVISFPPLFFGGQILCKPWRCCDVVKSSVDQQHFVKHPTSTSHHFKSRLNRLFPPILMLTLNFESTQLNELNSCRVID